MFSGCSGLTRAPKLPATELEPDCYFQMFYGCNGLTKAPVLPASKLVKNCYYMMFLHCRNINYVKCLATENSAIDCTKSWLSGVAATGTFVKADGMNGWLENSDSNATLNPDNKGYPAGWTVKTVSEEAAEQSQQNQP